MRAIRGRAWLLAALVLFLLPLGACEQRPVIHVALNGLTDSVVSLSVSGTLAGRSLDGDSRPLNEARDSFDVYLQTGDIGALSLEVDGIDDSGCQIGAGTGQLTISGAGNYDVEITLSYVAANQGCQVIVNKRGTGQGNVGGDVTDDFTAASADQIYYNGFALGTPITLTATVLSGSYFAGWAGGTCSGTGSCTLTISSRPQTVTAAILPNKLCVGSICWEHPLPQGSSLNAVFGVASDDLWMIGEEGTLLHWNGVYTEASTIVSSATLHAGWGSASSSVWAVGDNGTILKWEGKAWAAETSSTGVALYAVWGSSADSIWAVGENGTILQRSGGAWTAQVSGVTTTLTSVWGSDSRNLWAAGEGGTILKWSPVSSRSC